MTDNDYGGFVSRFVSDKDLGLKIKNNVLFVENNLYRVDAIFEDEIEKQIMYRELGVIAYSCFEALLKTMLKEINARCKTRCQSAFCRYRRYNTSLKIERAKIKEILSFLVKTRLIYFHPHEVDEIEKLNELRNYVHISKNRKIKIDDNKFDLAFVERILRYYYQLTDQFDLCDYYFRERDICLKDTDEDNMRFEIDSDYQIYNFLLLVPVLHKVYLNESLTDEDVLLLRKMDHPNKVNFDEVSNYAVDLAKRYGRRFTSDEAYETANKEYFGRLSQYLSKAHKDELLNKYANIEIECDNKSFYDIAKEIEKKVTKNG